MFLLFLRDIDPDHKFHNISVIRSFDIYDVYFSLDSFSNSFFLTGIVPPFVLTKFSHFSFIQLIYKIDGIITLKYLHFSMF